MPEVAAVPANIAAAEGAKMATVNRAVESGVPLGGAEKGSVAAEGALGQARAMGEQVGKIAEAVNASPDPKAGQQAIEGLASLPDQAAGAQTGPQAGENAAKPAPNGPEAAGAGKKTSGAQEQQSPQSQGQEAQRQVPAQPEANAQAAPRAEAPGTADDSAEMKKYIEDFTKEGLQDWDAQNPEPAKNTKEHDEWEKKRVDQQSKLTVDARVNNDLKVWESEHPMPDKDKNPEEYNKWLREKVKQRDAAKEKHGADKKGEKEESEQSDAEKAARLQELMVRQAKLVAEILEMKRAHVPKDFAPLVAKREELTNVNQQIKTLQTELGKTSAKSMAGLITILALAEQMSKLANGELAQAA